MTGLLVPVAGAAGETQTMLRTGRFAAAGAYIVASVLGGITAAALGFLAAR